uniref:Uncharacterized protein n=1 Tax=Arundo donax TaxID=35708 RepID=A0A0A9FJX8_ARUDO
MCAFWYALDNFFILLYIKFVHPSYFLFYMICTKYVHH